MNSPESSAYNVAFTARIVSEINTTALKKSFQKILNRHPSLRTTYFLQEGKPVQMIHGYKEIYFEEISCRGLSEDKIKEKVSSVYKIPFDLENGPIFKVYLFKVDEDDNILLINMHHICSDGWSIGIILNELSELYSSEAEGKKHEFPQSKFHYSNFIQYQQELVKNENGENLWDYWKNELSGELPVLNLPADRSRPAVQSYIGNTEYFKLDNDLVNSLKELSRQEGTTLFVILQTVFQILLHKYSGQDEIIVGSPTAGRNKPDFENIVGYFINPVSIKGHFTQDQTFKELLKQIKKKVLGAMANQDFPFPVLVEKLLHKRDASRSPVFQTFFGLQKVQGKNEIQEILVPGNKNVKIQFGKLVLEQFELPQQEGQFDLLLEFFEGENLFAGVLKYNTEIFESSRIKAIPDHLKAIIKSITSDPEGKISAIQIITEKEKHSILNEWNNTDVNYDNSKLLPELISVQAEKSPDSIAAEIDNEKLTYKELDQITNQLANYLNKAGVGKDTFVGVYIDRSLEMIIALLGIIKAGGAYVPIDPSYPKERVEYMISDSQVKIILSKKETSENISGSSLRIINLDTDIKKIKEEPITPPVINLSEDNLAYMIYTSGSTGKPKGAMNTHGAILNRLLWMKEYLQITKDDNIFQKTSFSFDVSVWEFFLPLISGAMLVFAKPDGQKETDYLVKEIIRKNITVMHFVPSMMQIFLADENADKCVSLRKVICSGEELTVSLQNLFFNVFKNTELHNLYGPTEAAVDVTYWKCGRDSKLNIVPIGKPIANTKIFILDPYLNLLPPGIPGELHIGGVQVGKGYFNREELTAEKFIADHFSEDKSARLYKTGDLTRYMYDGNIEYLGRIDNQIKIRGFRIELGEIEFIMNQFRGISEAIVIVKEIKQGDKRLIGFIVPEKNETVNIGELRNFMKEKLPEYMIPSQFVILDQMPLSQNGKADRSKLSGHEFSRDELQSEFKAATKPVEEILARIWAEVLSVDKVGINDNFFELGGDSIISIQIIFKAAKEGLRITTRQMFQFQTIADLASVIETDFKTETDQNIVTGDVPLTPVQHWFFEQNLNEPGHFNHNLLVDVPKNLNPDFLKKTSDKIVKHHDALRLEFNTIGSELKQINSDYKKANIFSIEDLSDISENQLSEKIKNNINEINESFKLSESPLIKIKYFKLPEGKTDRLLIAVHHLCIDGISWRILLEDIYTAYNQLSNEEEIKLSQKTSSYKDWSNKLTEFSGSKFFLNEKEYWLNLTDELIKGIPKDNESGINSVESEETVPKELDKQYTEALLKEVPKSYNTKINDILLSALMIACFKWTNENKLLINLEGHGREELPDSPDVSRTIGWFTSIYPVILKADDPANTGDVIKSVKETLRSIPNGGIGFGILKYLSKDVETGKKFRAVPKPDIVFNYLGQINESIADSADWRLGKDMIILSQSEKGIREHLLEINIIISDNRLKINFTFSKNIFNPESIEKFSEIYISELKNIIDHCTTEDSGGYTPSDFSAAGLDQQELDNLLANLN